MMPRRKSPPAAKRTAGSGWTLEPTTPIPRPATTTWASHYQKGSNIGPDWQDSPVDLPPESIQVKPLDMAFRDFMDDKISSDKPIPPLKSTNVGLKGYTTSTKDASTETEEVYTEPFTTTPPAQSPPPAPAPPQHLPTVPQYQERTVQMETDQDALKRQLSGEAQMAVMQVPRPMPNPQGESFQHGSSVMEFAKANFRPLGPPSRDEERRGAHLEQLHPTQNALSVLSVTGNIQAPRMSTLGAGPFGMSQFPGQPSGSRVVEPVFPSSIGRQPPPGQFGMPAAAAPTMPPSRQLDAEAPAFAPGQAQPQHQSWEEAGDPWAQPYRQNHRNQGRGAWANYPSGQGDWGTYMVNNTTEDQTKEINTVLSSLRDKYGGERESFNASCSCWWW